MSRAFTCNRCKAVTENEMATYHDGWTRLTMHGTMNPDAWRDLDFCADCTPPLRQLIDNYVKGTT